MSYADVIVNLTDQLVFEEKLDVSMHIAHRQGWGGALLYIVLDGPADEPLSEAARSELEEEALRRLKETSRDGDLLLPLQGPTYLAWLQNVDMGRVVEVADRIGERLGEPYCLPQATVETTSRIGVALYPFDGVTLEELRRRALYAFLQGKGRGDRVTIYDPIGSEPPRS